MHGSRKAWGRAARGVVATGCALALGAGTAHAEFSNGFSFDGAVSSVLTVPGSGASYVGGDFTGQLGDAAHYVAVSAGDGVRSGTLPAVDGPVTAVTGDGAGGLYVGGSFTRVGDYTRRNLAHIRADGTVDAAWDPSPDDRVTDLDRVGTRLAVTGAFTAIGGRSFGAAPHYYVAVLDTATGRATAFTPPELPVEPGIVPELDAVGDRLYVKGRAEDTPDGPRATVSALDLATGAQLSWRADLSAVPRDFGDEYLGLGMIREVGGTVVVVVGQSRGKSGSSSHLVALDRVTGRQKWIRAGGGVLVNGGDRLYALESGATALDPATGRVLWTARASLSYDPLYGTGPLAAYLQGDAIYVTGGFTVGADQRYAAAFDTRTGALLPWNPRLSAKGARISGLGGRIVLAGDFESAGRLPDPLAKLVRLTAAGTLDRTFTPPAFAGCAPSPTDVTALALEGTTLYVGGTFTAVGGRPRTALAAIDTRTGAVLPFAVPDGTLSPCRRIAQVKLRPDRIEVTVGSASYTEETWAFRRDGTLVPTGTLTRNRLVPLGYQLAAPFPATTPPRYTGEVPGTLTVQLTVPGTSYVVASTSVQVDSTTEPTPVPLTLDAVGAFIRTYYPGYVYSATVTFTPRAGEFPPVTGGFTGHN